MRDWPVSIALPKSRNRFRSASEDHYRLMFELNPNPMWIFDESTLSFLAVNEAAIKLYGWSREEFLRMTIIDIRPPEETPKLARKLAVQRGSRAAFVGGWQHWKKDGTKFEVEVTISCLQFQGRDARLTMVNDVTARKQAEEQLRQLNATLERRVATRTEELTRANELLLASEQVLADFFGEAPLGLLWLAPDGRIQHVNQAEAALLDRRVEQLLGRHLGEFCANPEVVRAMVSALARKEPIHDNLVRLLRQDRSIRHVLVDANGAWQNGRLTHSRWFFRDISRQVELQKEILAISERVRRQIGHDLHDDVCQRLTSIAYLGRALERRLSAKSRPDAARAREIASLTQQAISSTRELSHAMSPMELGVNGLPGALKDLAVQTKRLFHIDCRFRCDKSISIDDGAAQTNLYRIAQEAIHNAIKHGKAKRIQIRLRIRRGDVVLHVEDDGVGLPLRPTGNKAFGLRVMDYRARALGGSLAVQKRETGGTTVVCSIPATLTAPATQHNLCPLKSV
jgi:PAS domain S-box-containing protein